MLLTSGSPPGEAAALNPLHPSGTVDCPALCAAVTTRDSMLGAKVTVWRADSEPDVEGTLLLWAHGKARCKTRR